MPEFATGGPIEALSPNAQDFIRAICDLEYPGYLLNATEARSLGEPILWQVNEEPQ